MKFFTAIFGFIVLLVLAVFLLSNRNGVDLGFWPFGAVLAVPLGAVVLAVFVAGFLAGLLFHLPSRLAAGRRARRAERRAAELELRQAVPVTPLPPAVVP